MTCKHCDKAASKEYGNRYCSFSCQRMHYKLLNKKHQKANRERARIKKIKEDSIRIIMKINKIDREQANIVLNSMMDALS